MVKIHNDTWPSYASAFLNDPGCKLEASHKQGYGGSMSEDFDRNDEPLIQCSKQTRWLEQLVTVTNETLQKTGWSLVMQPSDPVEVTVEGEDKSYLTSGYFFNIQSVEGQLPIRKVDSVKLKKILTDAFNKAGVNKPHVKRTDLGAWVSSTVVGALYGANCNEGVMKTFGAHEPTTDPYKNFMSAIVGGLQQDSMRKF